MALDFVYKAGMAHSPDGLVFSFYLCARVAMVIIMLISFIGSVSVWPMMGIWLYVGCWLYKPPMSTGRPSANSYWSQMKRKEIFPASLPDLIWVASSSFDLKVCPVFFCRNVCSKNGRNYLRKLRKSKKNFRRLNPNSAWLKKRKNVESRGKSDSLFAAPPRTAGGQV